MSALELDAIIKKCPAQTLPTWQKINSQTKALVVVKDEEDFEASKPVTQDIL